MRAHTLRLVAALLSSVVSISAFAVSGGLTGVTNLGNGTGCNGCHGAAGGNVASVTITGTTSLPAGQTAVFTVTATQTAAAAGVKMGLNVAASDGTLSTFGIEPTSVVGNEIKHNSAVGALKTTSGGSAFYQFNYTMPAAAVVGSSHTLAAVSALSFSGWRHATNFTVLTRPLPPTSVTPSNITPTTVDLSWVAGSGGPTYRVVYKTGPSIPVNPTDGTTIDLGAVTSTTVTNLTANTEYSFTIFSKDAGSTVFSSTGVSTTITTLSLNAAPRYVNATTGVNTGNCSVQANPCKTITYAMAQAVAGNPGDLIDVAPGTYNLALGEVFPITFKPGVRLVANSPIGQTTIDAAGDTVKQGVIKSSGNASNLARIEGFVIANGVSTPNQGGVGLGGGVYIQTSSATFTIERNIFYNNEARGYSADNTLGMTGGLGWGGGLYVFSSPVNVINNVFLNNTARGGNGYSHLGTPLTGNEYGGQGQGGAIYYGGSGVIINNTFVGNVAVGGNGGGSSTGTGNGGGGMSGGIQAGGNPAPTVDNNIFYGNFANSGTGGTPDASSASALVIGGTSPGIRNNLYYANLVNGAQIGGDTLGTSFVASDPKFHSAALFKLRMSSPARNAGRVTGAPTTDIFGVTRPGTPAIGAVEASLILTTTALVPSANPSTSGQAVTFTATVTGENGVPDGTVTFKDGVTPVCSGVALVAGQAQCVATLSDGSHQVYAEYSGSTDYSASQGLLNQTVGAANPPRLANISTRAQVLTGENVMIAGFIIGGSTNKTVVIRARGPSLAPTGISNFLANPLLQLFSGQTQLAVNDNFGTASNLAALQASGFAPADPFESAILTTLAPGPYTAIVTGAGSTTGVGLVEVFEVDAITTPLINIATRGRVLTGNDVMIAGLIIQGSGPQQVVIRARGPSMIPSGVTDALLNPHLQIFQGQTQIAVNDDWGGGAQAAAIQSAGFAPADSRESAVMMTLQPGAYTAIVTGVGGTVGIAIVEVFTVP